MSGVAWNWAAGAGAAWLAAGAATWAAWRLGQALADAGRPAEQHAVPGGWWMGFALTWGGWGALIGLCAAGRDTLALGQVVGGGAWRTLAALPAVAAVWPATLRQPTGRWLVLAAAVFPLLLLLCGMDGKVDALDGELLLTVAVVVLWASVQSERPEDGAPRLAAALPASRRRVLLVATLTAVLAVVLAAAAGVATAHAWPPGWRDRPFAVTVVGAAAAWPAAPIAISMARRWGPAAAVRGLTLGGILSLGLTLALTALVRRIEFTWPLWRIDGWVLLLVGLLPLPLAMRGTRFGRVEAVSFVAFCVLYVFATWAATI